MNAAKTAAQRQAERKARELAAGRVQWKRWVHPGDAPALTEYADKLARKRARAEQKSGITGDLE
jgi:ribonuclease HI